MAEHTPGPWIVRTFPHSGDHREWVTDSKPDEGGKFVGQLIAAETTAPETRANMRLIAGAPDLLAAAECAVAALTQTGTFPADITLAVSTLRAAIARATGK